jgi:uncharacterized protein (DUF2141 family)
MPTMPRELQPWPWLVGRRDKKEAVAFRREFGENYTGMVFVKTALFSLGLALMLALPSEAHSEITASEGACDGASLAIDVQVHGIRNDRGHVMFVLYGDKPEDFLVKGKKIFKQSFAVNQGTVEFCVILAKPGIYAAAAYHDENANRKFDKNWVGLPVEGSGVSNNPKTFLGSPTHDQAAFKVSQGPTRVDIEIKY